MGLLDTPPSVERTPAQKIADNLRELARDTAQKIENNYRTGYDLLWGSEDPQAVLDELGQDAGELFALTNGSMGMANPAALKAVPPGYAYTLNPDGTITLTHTPPLDD